MMPRARFAFLVVVPFGCAVEASDVPLGGVPGPGAGGSAGQSNAGAPAGGSDTSGGAGGTGSPTAGSPPTAGTFSTAGNGGAGGTGGDGVSAGTGGASAGGGGTSAGGTGGAGGGSGGKSSGGSAGTGTAGSPTAGTGGSGTVGAYCDTQPKEPLPYTVNRGFQPSGWQGDIGAISIPTVTPNACQSRPAGAEGTCGVWRYTPNAVSPAWSGVSWIKQWDPGYTHPNVCLADGAGKVTFQARGAAGGEQVTFAAAGAAEITFTLTGAWVRYEIPLTGVTYNTYAEGVTSGFFWKVTPPTPAGAPVTFFIDDIRFVD